MGCLVAGNYFCESADMILVKMIAKSFTYRMNLLVWLEISGGWSLFSNSFE
jgi:hypothetical protein